MDWTSWTGRSGPVELDALRLLVLLHRLGDDPGQPDEPEAGGEGYAVVRALRDEGRVQCLDHLLAHPATLAYLLMDAFLQGEDDLAGRRGALARRVRWLLAHDRRRYDPARRGRSRRRVQAPSATVDSGRLHRFQPFVWRRWDDQLAALQSRGLLRVTADPELAYGLTARAANWLDSEVYATHGDSGFHAQICTVLADYLPDLDDVAERLATTGQRLSAFRRDRGLTAGDDSAGPRFHTAFRERL